MRRMLQKFPMIAEERGTTAIEYALIASLISIVIVTAATSIGTKLTSIFSSVSTGF
jgi:pilus assembly protein Flp/PilA